MIRAIIRAYVEDCPLRHLTTSIELKASYVILDASESTDCCALRMGDIREEVNDMIMKETGIPAMVTRVTLHEMMNARTTPARILTMCNMNAPRG